LTHENTQAKPTAAYGSRLVCFLGTTPNIGTTIVSFGSAVRLAMETELSVGYLCLNLKSSKLHRYLGIDDAPFALDNLRVELKSGGLEKERLLRCCETLRGVPNLQILFGSVLREQAEYFQPEDINVLLDAALSAFDICIVEVNAYWDNAATVCCTLRSDAGVIVTSPDIAHFQEDMQRWYSTISPILGLDHDRFRLAVNYLESGTAGGIGVNNISRETKLEIVAEIPRYPEILAYTNQGKLLSLFLENHAVSNNLDGIVGMFATLCGTNRRLISVNRSWLRRLFPRVVG
jgi:MinD-like ATPase involved in chromosome partitioning or flagellar assembly